MARGSESKEIITAKILEAFEGSFINEKEIRIPMIENGEEVQVKVTLTAAKTNVEHGMCATEFVSNSMTAVSAPSVAIDPEPTAEEKERLAKLVSTLF